jgi:hypothetical protein
LLPRPWLTPASGQILDAALIERGDADPLTAEQVYRSESGRVYVKGAIRRDDELIRCAPYWHQLVLHADAN